MKSLFAFASIAVAAALLALPAIGWSQQRLVPTTLTFDVQPPGGKVMINGGEYPNGIRYAPLPAGRRYTTPVTVIWCDGKSCVEQKLTVEWTAGVDQLVRVQGPAANSGPGFAPGQIEGATQQADGVNFGLQVDKMPAPKEKESFTIGDHAVNREAAVQAVAGELPDDRKTLRLTVVGEKSFTGPILDDLSKSGVKKDLLVQTFTPDAWQIKERGFPPGNQLILQAPDGKVLHRQADYAGGFESLQPALQRGVSAYDPKKDPDLRSGDGDQTAWLLGLLLAAAAMMLR